MSTDQGYVLLHRRYWRHPLFKPALCTPFEAWVWLNMNAMHTPGDVSVTNGRHRATVRLEAGQLAGSVRFLADKWQWSDKRVQRFLAVLKRDQLVTTETTTGQTIITLCNWGEDQRPFAAATTQTATQSTTQTTTKEKELKELKKKTLFAEGFEEWYAAYPKHVDRIDAARAYAKVIASGSVTHADLMAAVARYAAKVAGYEKKYIKGPAVWLNKGSYLDEPDAVANPVVTLLPVNPAEFSDAKWQRNLKLFQASHVWSNDWGPQIGEPGCHVPPRLIGAPVSEGSLRVAVATPLHRENPADW